jgi:iron complex transport system substrate-binding protein
MLERFATLIARHGVVALGLVCALAGGPVSAKTLVQDDRGVSLSFEAPPQRIVSLLPAITEMVCDLGACDRLVGVDRHSNQPAQVRALPRLGGMDDTPLERVLQLKPDLVLLAGSTRLLSRMQDLGLRVMAFEPHDTADAQRMAQALSQVLVGSDAAWLRHEQRQHKLWNDVAAVVPARLRGSRLYIEVGAGPYVAAQPSFIGQALQRVGLASAVPGTWGVFPRLSPEWVLREQPDWVVLSHSAAKPEDRPGWAQLSAWQKRQVCILSADEMDMLVRPGPRLPLGVAALVSCMQTTPSP